MIGVLLYMVRCAEYIALRDSLLKLSVNRCLNKSTYGTFQSARYLNHAATSRFKHVRQWSDGRRWIYIVYWLLHGADSFLSTWQTFNQLLNSRKFSSFFWTASSWLPIELNVTSPYRSSLILFLRSNVIVSHNQLLCLTNVIFHSGFLNKT